MRSLLEDDIRLLPRAEQLLQRASTHRRDVGGTAQMLETVDRGLDQIVGVAAAQALGQDVLDSRHLEHRAHAGSRDHSGAGRSGLEHDAAGAEPAHHRMRNRSASRHRDVEQALLGDRKSTRLNSSHGYISYAVFCLKKKKKKK